MSKEKLIKDIIQGDLIEVKAYRDLQDTSFDFGLGVITNDSNISEDVHYRINEQYLETLLEDVEDKEVIKELKIQKPRLNRYARKKIGKRKLNKLKEQDYYFVRISNNGRFLRRVYLSGSRKYAKKETNKRIRNMKEDNIGTHGAYRKYFDYWDELF